MLIWTPALAIQERLIPFLLSVVKRSPFYLGDEKCLIE